MSACKILWELCCLISFIDVAAWVQKDYFQLLDVLHLDLDFAKGIMDFGWFKLDEVGELVFPRVLGSLNLVKQGELFYVHIHFDLYCKACCRICTMLFKISNQIGVRIHKLCEINLL